ncbi:Cannabidiolic acid synthase-like 1, partial [Mucuna pruriens]
MYEISESKIPFLHRFGIIFHIQYGVYWQEEGDEAAQRHIKWIRRLYKYIEPYVLKSPRAAYLNYRDLDVGVNNNGYTSYNQVNIWGFKYFKNNFNMLTKVKTKVDPLNFFRNEQVCFISCRNDANNIPWGQQIACTTYHHMMSLNSYFVIVLLFSFSLSWADSQEKFIQCLYNYLRNNNTTSISNIVYTQTNASYSIMIDFSIQNRRFFNASLKPPVIVTPLEVSQIQATIVRSQHHHMQIRTRSGGHDYEGLSYVAQVPFVIIDLINLREIQVNLENSTAWVQTGATIGVLVNFTTKSKTLGFPAGVCPTVGIGGHFSGGGYGFMMRKYGLAADNIIDAHIVDVRGILLDRKAMGEDLFWAIRGGGGTSFGVIVAWKIKLVAVPSTLTVFSVPRTLEHNATEIIHKWQLVANELDNGLMIKVHMARVNLSQNGKPTIQTQFESTYLGGVDQLIPLMQKSLPELGLMREDCTEMSWIDSILYMAGLPRDQSTDVLLNRTQLSNVLFYKAKSDYVRDPIPDVGLQGLWPFFYEDEAQHAVVQFTPYGGRMDEISESEIPFPHRYGNIFHIQYGVYWQEEGDEATQRHINWIRRVYKYMEPYVSKSPRAAYLNYRDLDIGVNNNGYTSYSQASIWGLKYFQTNFNRLARVKTKVDPKNFFRNEQSIPTLMSDERK